MIYLMSGSARLAVMNKFLEDLKMKTSIFVGEKNGKRWYAVKFGDLFLTFDFGVVSRLCLKLRIFPEDLDLGDNFID